MAKPKVEPAHQRLIGMPGVTYSRLDRLRKVNGNGKKESWARYIYRVLPILEKMKE